MHRALLFLTTALCLTLTSCASWRKAEIVYVPPRIDCAAFDPPQIAPPEEPSPAEKQPAVWMLFAWHWQAYAAHVLNQRIETADCLGQLRERGVIK